MDSDTEEDEIDEGDISNREWRERSKWGDFSFRAFLFSLVLLILGCPSFVIYLIWRWSWYTPGAWCEYGALGGYWAASNSSAPHWHNFQKRSCQVQDLLPAIAFNPNYTHHSSKKDSRYYKQLLREGASIMFLSDSVDRHILTYMCDLAGGQVMLMNSDGTPKQLLSSIAEKRRGPSKAVGFPGGRGVGLERGSRRKGRRQLHTGGRTTGRTTGREYDRKDSIYESTAAAFAIDSCNSGQGRDARADGTATSGLASNAVEEKKDEKLSRADCIAYAMRRVLEKEEGHEGQKRKGGSGVVMEGEEYEGDAEWGVGEGKVEGEEDGAGKGGEEDSASFDRILSSQASNLNMQAHAHEQQASMSAQQGGRRTAGGQRRMLEWVDVMGNWVSNTFHGALKVWGSKRDEGGQESMEGVAPRLYLPHVCWEPKVKGIRLLATYLPGVHPNGPFHKGVKEGWKEQVDEAASVWRQVFKKSQPEVVVVASALWDLARLHTYEPHLMTGPELPTSLLESWSSNFTEVVLGVRKAMPKVQLFLYHTTMAPKFNPKTGMMDRPYLGRRFYITQMNVAGRYVASQLGMDVLEYPAIANRFMDGQTYLKDAIHPNREVGLEIANLYLNYAAQVKAHRDAEFYYIQKSTHWTSGEKWSTRRLSRHRHS